MSAKACPEPSRGVPPSRRSISLPQARITLALSMRLNRRQWAQRSAPCMPPSRCVSLLRHSSDPPAPTDSKVTGYRIPSRANQEAFDKAVAEIAVSTRILFDSLVTR